MLWWLWIPRKHLEPAQVMNIMCQVKIKLTNLGILKPVDLCHCPIVGPHQLAHQPLIHRSNCVAESWHTNSTGTSPPNQNRWPSCPVGFTGRARLDHVRPIAHGGGWWSLSVDSYKAMWYNAVSACPGGRFTLPGGLKKEQHLENWKLSGKTIKVGNSSATPQKSTTTSRGEKRPPFRTPQASPFSSAMCAPCHPTGSALPCRLTVLMNVEWTTPFGGLAWDSMGIHRQLWAYRHILGQHGPTNLQICRVSNFIAIQDQTAKTHHVLQLYT